MFAGCTGSPGSAAANGVASVAAREMLDEAITAARNWSQDAKLKIVATAEHGTATSDFPDEEARSVFDDGALGDGKARFWQYTFHAQGASRAIDVLMEAPGKVVRIEWVTVQRDALPLALEGWEVESDVAAAKAAKDPKFQAVLGKHPAMATAALVHLPGEPAAWLFQAYETMTSSPARVLVDAKTGALLDAKAFEEKFIPKLEGGREEGRVTPLEASKHRFTIKAEFHPQLSLRFDPVYTFLPAVKLNVTLTSATRTYMFDWVLADPGPNTRISSKGFAHPRAGDYQVSIRLVGMDLLGLYRMSWCADGEPVSPKPAGCP